MIEVKAWFFWICFVLAWPGALKVGDWIARFITRPILDKMWSGKYWHPLGTDVVYRYKLIATIRHPSKSIVECEVNQ